MKTLQKLGIFALIVLLCMAAAILTLMQIGRGWRTGIKPLSPEEITRPAGRAGHQEPPTERPEHDKAQTAQDSGPHLAPGGKLAALPTEEQRIRRFVSRSPKSQAELTKQKAELLVGEAFMVPVYSMRSNATDEWTRTMPFWFSAGFLGVGEFDKARTYLREGVRTEDDDFMRRWLCGRLAWLEDDPQTALALLVESCGGSYENGARPLSEPDWGDDCHAYNALDLAVATGSEEAAEYFFQRYHDSWQQWQEEDRSCLEETRTWLEERLGGTE